MKRVALTALAFALGLTVSVNGAMAQDKMRDVKDRAVFTLDSGHVDSKHVIGMKVKTPDGKHVGEIDQLIINVRDGKVSHAIVGLGGFAGVGERHVVVPWSEVKLQADRNDRKDMIAMIDRAALDSARRYSRDVRDRVPAASPATAPAADRDRDGVPNRIDRAPNNPDKK
jgi:sporulation protein YlmC with PRC-barrel domain